MRRVGFNTITYEEFLSKYICRSIFDVDKLLFSLIFTMKILQMNGKLNDRQLDFFMTDDATDFHGSILEKPNFDWISEKMWCELNKLSYIIEGNDDCLATFLTNID